jgi:hypothetical protein
MNLETITELPDILGISSAMESWNVSNDNDNQRATKMRIRAIAESNHNVKAHLDNYYRTDTDIMKNILGYLPNR